MFVFGSFTLSTSNSFPKDFLPYYSEDFWSWSPSSVTSHRKISCWSGILDESEDSTANVSSVGWWWQDPQVAGNCLVIASLYTWPVLLKIPWQVAKMIWTKMHCQLHSFNKRNILVNPGNLLALPHQYNDNQTLIDLRPYPNFIVPRISCCLAKSTKEEELRLPS